MKDYQAIQQGREKAKQKRGNFYLFITAIVALLIVLTFLGAGLLAIKYAVIDPIYYHQVDQVEVISSGQEYLGDLIEPPGIPWKDWYRALCLGQGITPSASRLSEEQSSALEWQFKQDAIQPWHRLVMSYSVMDSFQWVPKAFLPRPQAIFDIFKNLDQGLYTVRCSQNSRVDWFSIPIGTTWFEGYLLTEGATIVYGPFEVPNVAIGIMGSNELQYFKMEPVVEEWSFKTVSGALKPIPPRLLNHHALALTEQMVLAGANLTTDKDVILGPMEFLQLQGIQENQQVEIRATLPDGSQVELEDMKDEYTFLPAQVEGVSLYEITVTTTANSNNLMEGRQHYKLKVGLQFDPLVSITDQKQGPGGFFSVTVKHVPVGYMPDLKQNIVDDIRWHRQGSTYQTMVPLDYWAKAGKYNYELKLIRDPESVSEIELAPISGRPIKTNLAQGTWQVVGREFPVQKLEVDTSVEETTRTDEAYEEYQRLFLPVRETAIQEKLWEGAFIMPVEGRKSTEYGMRRSVNGSLTTYRHNGIDLAIERGTPVLASNSGRVRFSQLLILTGNSIIIDHGQGLFTVYLHLDKRLVSEGQSVKKGQQIGTVGSTGFSTGPHLHFTTSYYRVNLDPEILIKTIKE